MKRLSAVVLCGVGLVFGSWAAFAGAAPKSGRSAGKECAALRKEMGPTAFKVAFRGDQGRHAMRNCKAQHS